MALEPILMIPSYRFGNQTPWGGNGLRAIFGKNIPDERTGEALEMSVIPGLNSRDPDGTTLSELIERDPVAMVGTGVKGPFPLLLKLLNARERLSVQVHPDDSYAAVHENKLGKTEAWIILNAEPGAHIIYGVKEGVTRDMLQQASEQGAEIEKLLRSVPVKAGDVFYIPAGTVHAILEGITLYEIQQSSDVTYRFYDWERRDAQGNKRPLHVKDAVAVTDLSLESRPVQPVLVEEGCWQLLKNPVFETVRRMGRKALIEPDKARFSVITAIGDNCLEWENGRLELKAGNTAFIPADCVSFTVGEGELLISRPALQE